MVLASLGPVLPALSERSGASLQSSGFLFVGRSCGYMVGSLVGGAIFDTIRHTHLPLFAGNLLCSLGCAILPSLRSLPAVAAAIFTQGCCMGLLDTGGNVLLIWLHGAGRVDPYMQAMHLCFALGAVLSPLLIDLVAPHSRAMTRLLNIHLAGSTDHLPTRWPAIAGGHAPRERRRRLPRGWRFLHDGRRHRRSERAAAALPRPAAPGRRRAASRHRAGRSQHSQLSAWPRPRRGAVGGGVAGRVERAPPPPLRGRRGEPFFMTIVITTIPSLSSLSRSSRSHWVRFRRTFRRISRCRLPLAAGSSRTRGPSCTWVTRQLAGW